MIFKGDDQLSIEWRFDFGEGISSNTQSALVRPFLRCLTEGSLPGKIVQIFYRDDKKHYILGSLCSTTGGRLLFFPTGDLGKLVSYRGIDYENSGFHIDHITLEKNFEDIHISPKNKKSLKLKLAKGKTLKFTDDSRLWFTMQARSLNDFEKVPALLKIMANDTTKEIERKIHEITESQRNAHNLIVYVSDLIESAYFINFEFFVCMNDAKIDSLIPVIAKPDHPKSDMEKRTSTTFTISVQGFSGTIELRVSKRPGSNDVPWKIFMGNEFMI